MKETESIRKEELNEEKVVESNGIMSLYASFFSEFWTRTPSLLFKILDF